MTVYFPLPIAPLLCHGVSLSLQETSTCSYLWYCRYIAFIAGIILYMWEWLSYRDHTLLLTELHQNTDLIRARLGIKSPLNQKRASGSVAMHGVQLDMQGDHPLPIHTAGLSVPVEAAKRKRYSISNSN